jgi:hypothetical protein
VNPSFTPHGWHWSDREDGVLLRDRDGARAVLGTCHERLGQVREPSSLERCTVAVCSDAGMEPCPTDVALALMLRHSLVGRGFRGVAANERQP